MIEHSVGIDKIIKKRLSENKGYMEILKSIYGADPREVWEIFKKYKQEKACNKKIGIQDFYLELPEPHPVYSQWRLTPESATRISDSIGKKRYEKICFLGCPVLSMKFESQDKVVLDIDQTLLNNIEGARKYDVNAPVPKGLEEEFDCVIADPPWYSEDIELFTGRAAQLAKVGGTIYVSVPRLLTRPSVPKERLDFQRWLSENNLILAEISSFEYEVPPFEYKAYEDIPLFTGEIWRVGDWLKLKKADNSYFKTRRIRSVKWLEFIFGRKRVFLREKRKDYEKPIISSLGNNILNSVSRRNPLISFIDIWSSRNFILHINSGYTNIKEMLSSLEQKYLNEKFDEKKIENSVTKKLVELISA